MKVVGVEELLVFRSLIPIEYYSCDFIISYSSRRNTVQISCSSFDTGSEILAKH